MPLEVYLLEGLVLGLLVLLPEELLVPRLEELVEELLGLLADQLVIGLVVVLGPS